MRRDKLATNLRSGDHGHTAPHFHCSFRNLAGARSQGLETYLSQLAHVDADRWAGAAGAVTKDEPLVERAVVYRCTGPDDFADSVRERCFRNTIRFCRPQTDR